MSCAQYQVHPGVRRLGKYVDDSVEVSGKTLKRSARKLEKQTRCIARKAIVGERVVLVADGMSKNEFSK